MCQADSILGSLCWPLNSVKQRRKQGTDRTDSQECSQIFMVELWLRSLHEERERRGTHVHAG